MYDQYYRLTGQPFQVTPDPQFYFESNTHRKAMAYLGYGLAQGEGFIVITGEGGAGKTTLVGHLMTTIDPQRLTASQIIASPADGDELIRCIGQTFGLATQAVDGADLMGQIETCLHQRARSGRRSLLIIDEAQNLRPSGLQQLWQLSNVQLGGQTLLQIFLLSQPGFQERVAAVKELEPLRQRIIATHQLDRLQAEEVGPYIEHHLKLVGWADNPRFTPAAYALLGQASGCVPRQLNMLVSRVLHLGAADRLDNIDERVVEAAVEAMGSDRGEGDLPATHPKAEPEVRRADAGLPEGVDNSGIDRLRALFAEVQALNAAINNDEAGASDGEASDQGAVIDPERIAYIEERLARAEARLDEQDEVLRRILSKLIEWAERDSRNGPFSSRVA